MLLCLCLFLFGYTLNMFYVSVFYHRSLCHGAMTLSPVSLWLVKYTGNWVTGIDPKAWICMHRLHHEFSDTPKDPHSPTHSGVFGVAMAQFKSYKRILRRLIVKDPRYLSVVADLSFDVSAMNRKGFWYLPYLLHMAIALILSLCFRDVWVGTAFFLGVSSHPVQGWLVNALAHRYGYRNHQTTDDSKNNVIVSLITFGEGYQNNHHHRPAGATFAHKAYEVDLGYFLSRIALVLGFLEDAKAPTLLPVLDGAEILPSIV